MQRWQCPIHNATLETFIWSIIIIIINNTVEDIAVFIGFKSV